MNFSEGFGGKRGVKNGNSKNVSLEKFWPSLEISEMFLMALEVLFSSDFYVSESQIFFANGSSLRFVVPFHLVYPQQSRFFRIHGYSLSNSGSRLRQ